MSESIVVDENGYARVEKDPNAVLDYSWNWTAWLAAVDDAYASKTIVVDGVTLDSSSVANVSTTVSGSLAANATTITVASTSGFAARGTLCIGTVVVTYTGKTSTTFTGCTGTPAATDGEAVKQTIITAWLSGGTAGETATATCRITTSSSPPRTDDRTIYLDVNDR